MIARNELGAKSTSGETLKFNRDIILKPKESVNKKFAEFIQGIMIERVKAIQGGRKKQI